MKKSSEAEMGNIHLHSNDFLCSLCLDHLQIKFSQIRQHAKSCWQVNFTNGCFSKRRTVTGQNIRGPMKFQISNHAREEIKRREIPLYAVESVLQKPDQIVEGYGKKRVYQSILDLGTGKRYLLRVIVDDTVVPSRVVTVYKTSKIKKYWGHS